MTLTGYMLKHLPTSWRYFVEKTRIFATVASLEDTGGQWNPALGLP